MPSATDLSDADLARQAAAGDRAAIAALYDRFAPELYRCCAGLLHNPADADDAVQDTFVQAVQHLGSLREPERVRAWLFSIARRTCWARSSQRSRSTPADPVALEIDLTALEGAHRADARWTGSWSPASSSRSCATRPPG